MLNHPHDTILSSSLRFLTELIAWVAGPWVVSLYSSWLIMPAIIVLATIITGAARTRWLLRGAPL